MMMLMGEMAWSINNILIYCEVGGNISKSFEEIDDEIDKIDWYLLPINMRRSLITIKIISQRTIRLRGFGSISGSRDVFKMVKMTMFYNSYLCKWLICIFLVYQNCISIFYGTTTNCTIKISKNMPNTAEFQRRSLVLLI